MTAPVRTWIFATLFLAATPVFAQAPVEELPPAVDAVGMAQRRIEFARQVLDQAKAQLRDADTEHRQALRQFDKAKKRLEEANGNLARARAASARAQKLFNAQASELERQRAGK